VSIRACIRTAAALAAATALIVTPAAQAATTAQAGGGCATHIDTPEPLGVNVLGIVCV
jgi:hypothetical protein